MASDMTRTPAEVWSEIQDLATKIVKGVLALGPEVLAEKYKEYLSTLPPAARNGIIVVLSPDGKKRFVLRRADIPQLLITNEEFRKAYLRVIVEGRW